MLEEVAKRAPEFDIIHFHTSQMHYPVMRRVPATHVTTLHGRLDMPELVRLYEEFNEIPLVSISDAQRKPIPCANWVGTVHHGLPSGLFHFHDGPGRYLAFVGRISPEKRVDRAIAIATACERPLRIAAKIDPTDTEYFEREIRHLLDHPLVEFVGEISEREKDDFIGNASALLFPIDWPEPFGIVMIEALACGVPVIAFRGGSVAEIIEPGVTGFIVDSVEEAIAAVNRIGHIDRRRCREAFERRFTAPRMTDAYVKLYTRLIAERSGGELRTGAA
jgi:glycosyltransferase involved in cell wall biosynthesis